MGKAKKRIIAKGKYNQMVNLTREQAIVLAVNKIANSENIEDLVSLFGLKAEELLEAGADYEIIKGLGRIFDV